LGSVLLLGSRHTSMPSSCWLLHRRGGQVKAGRLEGNNVEGCCVGGVHLLGHHCAWLERNRLQTHGQAGCSSTPCCAMLRHAVQPSTACSRCVACQPHVGPPGTLQLLLEQRGVKAGGAVERTEQRLQQSCRGVPGQVKVTCWSALCIPTAYSVHRCEGVDQRTI
jgi:hypothetical protein